MIALALLLAIASTIESQGILRAERDVPRPARVRAVPAEYPSVLRGGMPVVMGPIFLDVVVDEEGRPIDIKVLSGVPLLDRSAVEAVKQWRYAPTIVDGTPRQVAVIEVIDLFPSEGLRAGYFAKRLNDPKAPKPYRMLALLRLKEIGLARKDVLRALEQASSDPDDDVRISAAEVLQALTKRSEKQPQP